MLGLVDDVRGLTPGAKLCGQIGAVLPLALWGGFHSSTVSAGLCGVGPGRGGPALGTSCGSWPASTR